MRQQDGSYLLIVLFFFFIATQASVSLNQYIVLERTVTIEGESQSIKDVWSVHGGAITNELAINKGGIDNFKAYDADTMAPLTVTSSDTSYKVQVPDKLDYDVLLTYSLEGLVKKEYASISSAVGINQDQYAIECNLKIDLPEEYTLSYISHNGNVEIDGNSATYSASVNKKDCTFYVGGYKETYQLRTDLPPLFVGLKTTYHGKLGKDDFRVVREIVDEKDGYFEYIKKGYSGEKVIQNSMFKIAKDSELIIEGYGYDEITKGYTSPIMSLVGTLRYNTDLNPLDHFYDSIVLKEGKNLVSGFEDMDIQATIHTPLGDFEVVAVGDSNGVDYYDKKTGFIVRREVYDKDGNLDYWNELTEWNIRDAPQTSEIKTANGKTCTSSGDCVSENCQNGVCCLQEKTCCLSTADCPEDKSCDTERFYCVAKEASTPTEVPDVPEDDIPYLIVVGSKADPVDNLAAADVAGRLGREGKEFETVLDTEVSVFDKRKNNLLVIGGPSVNILAKELELSKWDFCTEKALPCQNPFSLIRSYEDLYTAGQTVTVVAGWEAGHTRLAGKVYKDEQDFTIVNSGCVSSEEYYEQTKIIGTVKKSDNAIISRKSRC